MAGSVIIVGAGVIGLSLAYELARRGRQVTVLEQAEPGGGASGAAAGIFPPPCPGLLDDAQEQLRAVAHRLHPQWHERLLRETGIDTGFRTCGGLYLARREAEAAALRVRRAEAEAEGVRCELLGMDELLQLEPLLAEARGPILQALLMPDEARIQAALHLKALTRACQNLGVRVEPQQGCLGWNSSGTIVHAARTAERVEYQGDQFVICAGAWTPQLVEPLGAHVPIEPRRGQIVVWRAPLIRINHVLNEGLRYLVPREDGRLLAGATVEDVGWDSGTTEEGLRQMTEFAISWVPRLEKLQPETAWAGLRPWTPDGMPYMGPLPGWDNAWICAGHFRSGLHLSPAVAVAMADVLDGMASSIDLGAFGVIR